MPQLPPLRNERRRSKRLQEKAEASEPPKKVMKRRQGPVKKKRGQSRGRPYTKKIQEPKVPEPSPRQQGRQTEKRNPVDVTLSTETVFLPLPPRRKSPPPPRRRLLPLGERLRVIPRIYDADVPHRDTRVVRMDIQEPEFSPPHSEPGLRVKTRLYNSDSPLRETRVVNMDTSQSVTRRASFSGPAEIYGQGSLLLTIEQNSASAEAEDSPAKLVQPDDKTILRSPSPPILRREDTEVIQLDTDVDTRSPPVLTRAIPLLDVMTGNQVEETETNDDDIQVMREGGNRENISISASTSSSSGFEDDHPIRSSSPLPPILTPQVSPRRDRVPRYFYRKVGPTPKTFGKAFRHVHELNTLITQPPNDDLRVLSRDLVDVHQKILQAQRETAFKC